MEPIELFHISFLPVRRVVIFAFFVLQCDFRIVTAIQTELTIIFRVFKLFLIIGIVFFIVDIKLLFQSVVAFVLNFSLFHVYFDAVHGLIIGMFFITLILQII